MLEPNTFSRGFGFQLKTSAGLHTIRSHNSTGTCSEGLTESNMMLDLAAAYGQRRIVVGSTRTIFVVVLLFLSSLIGNSVSLDASTTEEDSPNLLRREMLDGKPRIIGGDIVNASEYRYPYFTSLEDYCGGALITPSIVVSAAHVSPKKLVLSSWFPPLAV
jgi:hypothetical protein